MKLDSLAAAPVVEMAQWEKDTRLARQGFKRLVILDFANYNWIVKQRVRELNLDTKTIQAVWVNPKQFAKETADKPLGADYGGGAIETSVAMALFSSRMSGAKSSARGNTFRRIPGTTRIRSTCGWTC